VKLVIIAYLIVVFDKTVDMRINNNLFIIENYKYHYFYSQPLWLFYYKSMLYRINTHTSNFFLKKYNILIFRIITIRFCDKLYLYLIHNSFSDVYQNYLLLCLVDL